MYNVARVFQWGGFVYLRRSFKNHSLMNLVNALIMSGRETPFLENDSSSMRWRTFGFLLLHEKLWIRFCTFDSKSCGMFMVYAGYSSYESTSCLITVTFLFNDKRLVSHTFIVFEFLSSIFFYKVGAVWSLESRIPRMAILSKDYLMFMGFFSFPLLLPSHNPSDFFELTFCP